MATERRTARQHQPLAGPAERGLAALEPLPLWPLTDPPTVDGEGLVIRGDSVWVASEGKLLQELALPADWQLQANRRLRSNGGPESLTTAGTGGVLLMAAENPLHQDPPDRVRLLRWEPATCGSLVSRPMQPLAIPPRNWGLTALLAMPSGLLGIWRRFEPPSSWQARLVLYPWPSEQANDPPLIPRQQWNLLQLGLAADNWEMLLQGPGLPDGRSSLLLASDDNVNPL